MAKRELSTTLKNLKFMQRATLKEEKIVEEEILEPNGSIFAPATQRRCIVIVEGDPHPGALRGRISFQNFNPSIDKLNEEAAIIHQNPITIIPAENGNIPNRSEASKDISQENNLDANLKRKQPAVEMDISENPNKSQKTETADAHEEPSSHNPNSSNKQKKQEKLNWNLLRRRKAQKKST